MPAIHVSESIAIDAPADEVFRLVRDFRRWPEFSPWLVVEPEAALDFAADGNSYSWEGQVVGAGSIAVTGEQPGMRIDYDLLFLKPFKSQAKVAFLFSEKDGATEVTWTMNSSLPFFLFFMKDTMSAMIASDYQRGLTMMKDLIEKGNVPSKLSFGECKADGYRLVGLRNSCSVDDVGPSMQADFETLAKWMESSGVSAVDKALSIYHKWDFAKKWADYTVGIPVEAIPSDLPGEFVTLEVPAHRALTVTHVGTYDHLGNAWSAAMMRSRAGKLKCAKGIHPYEIYENDPKQTAPEELVTVVHIPIR